MGGGQGPDLSARARGHRDRNRGRECIPTADAVPESLTPFDTLRFNPDRVTVEAGEKVRFVVTNVGSNAHEFVLGDQEVQMSREEEMGGGEAMDHGGTEMPALSLAPGETMEAVVTFDQPGEVLFGCHVSEHYSGGMVGTIRVT
ncbi:MAG: cupredoxin domain-containing protein [Actinomycetota bacterium]